MSGSQNNYDLNSPLQDYLKDMISKLPNATKLIVQTLAKQDFNKEDLSLNARVRRGELNAALVWVESLGLVDYSSSGRQKLYSLTPLGRVCFDKYNEIFLTLNEEKRD